MIVPKFFLLTGDALFHHCIFNVQVINMVHTRDGLVVVSSSGIARIWEPSSGILKWETNLATAAENE